MPNTINLYDTYTMIALMEKAVPMPSFIRDRYFPTNDQDLFGSSKVLVDYMKRNERITPFISNRAGDIPLGRDGYATHEIEPTRIAPSRLLSEDDLKRRGFGEALFNGSSPAIRAARLQQKDLADLDSAIAGAEEWFCAKVMLNNEAEIQTYIDEDTKGEKLFVKYFDGVSKHKYTPAHLWSEPSANIMGDVEAMADSLTDRGMPAQDLLVGNKAYHLLMSCKDLKEQINTTSGIDVGHIREIMTSYPGIIFAGVLNFGGHMLNVFKVRETYLNPETGKNEAYFPETGITITAPGCGHMLYGQVTQIDYGSTVFADHVGKRIPKLVVNQDKNLRKLVLTARPLAAPLADTPWVSATVCE